MLLKPIGPSTIVDDKTQYPDSDVTSNMDEDEITDSQTSKSLSLFDRLYRQICRLTGNRDNGDDNNDAYHYDVAPTQDDMENFANIYPPHWMRQSRRARLLKWLTWVFLSLPIVILCLL